jgi:tetratricopeptide (TPR) repeat protein
VLREELSRLGRLLRAERYAEAVALEADLPPAQACDRLIKRYRPVTEPGAAPRDLRALAHEVCARLVRARRALSKADEAARGEEAALVAQLRRLRQAELFYQAGRAALDGGRPEEALPSFVEACALAPEEGEFLAYLGYTRSLTSPWHSEAALTSLAELRRAQALAPKSDEVHALVGRVLRGRGDFPQACVAYESALAQNPNNMEAREGIASLTWGKRASA